MHPADFARLRERLAAPRPTLPDLSSCAAALTSLAQLEAARQQSEPTGAPVRRIAIAGDCSVQLLAQAVICAVAQEGELAQVHAVPYEEMQQQCLEPNSALHAFRPDTVLLVPDWRTATPPLPAGSSTQMADKDLQEQVQEQVQRYARIWDALLARGCHIIQHLLVPAPHQPGGVAQRRDPTSVNRRVDALNAALLQASAGRVTWIEADSLATQLGLEAWSSPRFWYAGRISFDPRFLPDYLPWFRGAWRLVSGRVKKLLVLDLDDTLWGGTIGDDGLDGIALGPGHGGRGEAFAAWQQHLAQLAARGVVLAVCSKNDEEIAAAGFAHPCAALHRGDFAAFVCNWHDKARNLRRVAAELNLGLDAMVFVDDNPAERALVMQALPEVSVVDIGTDPAQFIARLEAGHWFDLQHTTSEDTGRTQAYAARNQAQQALEQSVDMAAYLAGLQMTASAVPAGPADLPRLAQMELKTNQFNLTGRRFSQPQLALALEDPTRLVLALHLDDRFADHGLVSSLVAVREQGVLRIDSWLLSCRVFGRTAEAFMFAELVRIARATGASAIQGEYIATARNGVVADLYPRLGFKPSDSVGRLWHRDPTLPLDDLACSITHRQLP
ncbi:HAD family hydrolase [Acidovorax sp. sic0104]|uniref:HAD-IIIC family phosphatase n=1 Tax=Acidovorax sp. sic0104 TaxID=2854784 RepID=UPI001C4588EE|nr:HAD-IIIC family phosphatase [Acidovorax sp. sic0104]MBV7540372.1 HAD-IIIC family phosphatase [Acidovorax sp. sic0104]